LHHDQTPHRLETRQSIRISAPVHGNATLKIALQRHLMHVSGIEESKL
jgi:hypothetical protein